MPVFSVLHGPNFPDDARVDRPYTLLLFHCWDWVDKLRGGDIVSWRIRPLHYRRLCVYNNDDEVMRISFAFISAASSEAAAAERGLLGFVGLHGLFGLARGLCAPLPYPCILILSCWRWTAGRP